MNSTATTTATKVSYWMTGRDDYGRSTHTAHASTGRTLGCVVRMPKGYVTKYPERVYLVNDYTNTARDAAVTYHRTLKAAKAHLAAVAPAA